MNHPRPLFTQLLSTASPASPSGLALVVAYTLVQVSGGSVAVAAGLPQLFDSHADIGVVGHAGSVDYDPALGTYRVTGGGENMWFDRDAFQFVWRQLSGDALIAADIHWPVPAGNPHRKACLMIRQSLDPGSAYVDVVVHGDGLVSLQYREAANGPTREIQARIQSPGRIQLERYGDFFTWSAAVNAAALERPGGCVRLPFVDPVYAGLAVCSHDQSRLEQAVFSKVELRTRESQPIQITKVESTLETVAIDSRDRRALYHTEGHWEAPNWSPDGSYLLYNSLGRIWRFPLPNGLPVPLDTGFANRCNNDHGISPDGRHLVISDQSETGQSLIYILPIEGGQPRRVTELAPSYWHGWSPDGTTLVYCAERNGEYDVYAIPSAGGPEARLTTAPGLDDGPEYSPDGRFIYFNSERTGRMQIWRMKSDATEQTQITYDEFNDWFPHPSPDGRWIVFLSYGADVKGHPANQDVMLRLMPTAGGEIQVLAKVFGGQGTINVPSWSPDSRHVAFVSYSPVFEPWP